MNVSLLNNLMIIGIIDGLIIAFAIIYFVLRSRIAKQVVKTETIARVVTETPKEKKQKVVVPIIQEPPKPKIVDDGLGMLIEEARKHSVKCSVCGAYVVFYDKGKFKSEGMTAAGVIAHLDASHKKNGE